MRTLASVRAFAVGAVSVVALAGCGGSSTTVTRTATTQAAPQGATAHATSQGVSKKQAGKAYLAAVAPANTAGSALQAKVKTWTDSTTGNEVGADAQPYEKALTTLRAKLLSLANAYPEAATDIKALVTAYAPIQGDLETVSSMNSFSAAAWVQQFATDLSKTGSAAAIVRSDLGLPPPANSP